jgi:hypothetical protein
VLAPYLSEGESQLVGQDGRREADPSGTKNALGDAPTSSKGHHH